MKAALALTLVLSTSGSVALAQRVEPAPQSTAAATVLVVESRWPGSIAVSAGMNLDFSLEVGTAGGKAAARMSIPMQGVKDAPLRDVKVEGKAMEFTLGLAQMKEAAWAHFAVVVSEDGAKASGTLKQVGQEFKVEMKRLAEGESAVKRKPQDPVAPFPYSQREVTYTNPVDGAVFAGTLTIPAGAEGKHVPAVVLITGSGPQNRDEELMGHRPFLVLSDALTRQGIAVLRVDDRGVGGSTSPKHGSETTMDFAGDVAAGVEFLKKQPEVDVQRIGLVGHSEGGLIAPIVASTHTDVAFIVMMAGTGVTGKEILEEQMIAMARAEGAGEESLKAQGVVQKKLLAAAVGNDAAALDAAMRELVAMQTAGTPISKEDLEKAVVQAKVEFENGWMKAFLTLDPRGYLKKTKCPVLVLNGSKDTQVLPGQNVPEITKALLEGGNGNFEVRVFPGLNHLFQTCKTGGASEYAAIDETIAPVVLETIGTWVKRQGAGEIGH